MPYPHVMSRRVLAVLLTVPFLLFPSARSTRAAASANVLLSRDRTEPTVAVDPKHPSIIVASANTNYDSPVGDTYPTAYFWSRDGGKTFGGGTMPIIRPYTTAADTTTAVADDGTVFYSYLGEQPSYCSGGRAAIIVAHSIDHGRSYRQPTMVDSDPDDDKPTMAIRSVPGKQSHVYLAWTRWHENTSDIWLSRSTDGGVHFSRPIMLHTGKPDNYGPVPVVGPDHRVYVFWAIFPEQALSSTSPTRIVMRASSNDGRAFGPLTDASPTFRAVPRMAQPGSLRNLTMPGVAVDRQGVISIAWAQVHSKHPDGSVDADIELARSSDDGRTWSRPVRINDSRTGDRFMPAVTDWPDGSVGVAFYDRRLGYDQLDVYAARVSPGTPLHISKNVRVTQRRAPISKIYYIKPGSTCFAPGRFFGDYIGAAAVPGGTLCVVWADTQLQVSGQTDIWFDRVRLLQPPQPPRRRRGASRR